MNFTVRACGLLLIVLAVHEAILPASAQARGGPGYGDLCQALSGYMQRHPQCRVFGYCEEVECNANNSGVHVQHITLTVNKCEDPVRVIGRVVGEDLNWQGTFSVSGEGQCQEILWPTSQYLAIYNRNASHLQFETHVLIEGDILFPLIPTIDIPLYPNDCTCADVQNATRNFAFPFPGMEHHCQVDNGTCGGFHCNISYAGGALTSDATIDPCTESVDVVVVDAASGSQVLHQVFQNTSVLHYTLESFEITVYVLINHYNYSMTISVLLNFLNSNTTLLPEQRVILDRSSCSDQNSFPAAPFPGDTSDGCPSNPITVSTTHPPTPTPTGYMQRHPQCRVSAYCQEVECSYANHSLVQRAALTVKKCEDPVRVIGSLVGEDLDWQGTFSVSGEGQCYQEILWPPSQYLARYNRNASHLQFEAHILIEGDILFPLIPTIDIPLYPNDCTCADVQNATRNFAFPIPGVEHHCQVDNGTCGGFHCNISYADTSLTSDAIIDPCTESVDVVVVDATSGLPVFHQVFQNTSVLHRTLESFDITVYVLINHYNYSMTMSVLLSFLNSNTTLLPEQRVILDRSSCSDQNSFPAAPFPGDTSDGCPSNPITVSTTQKPGSSSVLAVAIAVPVSLVVAALVSVCISVALCLCFFQCRKRREVRFRRMAFETVDEDNEDLGQL